MKTHVGNRCCPDIGFPIKNIYKRFVCPRFLDALSEEDGGRVVNFLEGGEESFLNYAPLAKTQLILAFVEGGDKDFILLWG